jgi:hypothetical protein
MRFFLSCWFWFVRAGLGRARGSAQPSGGSRPSGASRRARSARDAQRSGVCARVFQERAFAGTVGDAERKPSELERSGGVRGGDQAERNDARSAAQRCPRERAVRRPDPLGASPRFRRSEGPRGPSAATSGSGAEGRPQRSGGSAHADPARRLRRSRQPNGRSGGPGHSTAGATT